MKYISIIPDGYFIVSDEDYDKLKQLKFYKKVCANGKEYIFACDRTSNGRTSISLYKLLFKTNNQGKYIHHINGNLLDYTRDNLMMKSLSFPKHKKVRPKVNSQYKGIQKTKNSSWRAIVYYEQKSMSICAESQVEAAIAYNVLSEYIYGKDANLNIVNVPDYEAIYNKLKCRIELTIPERKSQSEQGRSFHNKNKTSQYIGVSWDKSRHKWYAKIRKNLKIHNLGRYESEVEAAQAYNLKAIELYGENAKINKINIVEKSSRRDKNG
jgi:hypothetical protein